LIIVRKQDNIRILDLNDIKQVVNVASVRTGEDNWSSIFAPVFDRDGPGMRCPVWVFTTRDLHYRSWRLMIQFEPADFFPSPRDCLRFCRKPLFRSDIHIKEPALKPCLFLYLLSDVSSGIDLISFEFTVNRSDRAFVYGERGLQIIEEGIMQMGIRERNKKGGVIGMVGYGQCSVSQLPNGYSFLGSACIENEGICILMH
jgi:hypothetical protein